MAPSTCWTQCSLHSVHTLLSYTLTFYQTISNFQKAHSSVHQHRYAAFNNSPSVAFPSTAFTHCCIHSQPHSALPWINKWFSLKLNTTTLHYATRNSPPPPAATFFFNFFAKTLITHYRYFILRHILPLHFKLQKPCQSSFSLKRYTNKQNTDVCTCHSHSHKQYKQCDVHNDGNQQWTEWGAR